MNNDTTDWLADALSNKDFVGPASDFRPEEEVIQTRVLRALKKHNERDPAPPTSGGYDDGSGRIRDWRRQEATPAQAGAVVWFRWDLLPSYLIDHCEGDIISEEGLQRAVAAMLHDPRYNPSAEAQAGAELPERLESFGLDPLDLHDQYAKGWNDCLDAIAEARRGGSDSLALDFIRRQPCRCMSVAQLGERDHGCERCQILYGGRHD